MNASPLILNLLFSLLFLQLTHALTEEDQTKLKAFSSGNPDLKSAKLNCNILVWGGGYSPSGNQVSLESNVRYFNRIKDNIGISKYKTKTLFADGIDNARDIQFRDPTFLVPEPNLILAEIFGSSRGIFNQYRNNNLIADAPSSIKEFDQWLKDVNETFSHSLNLIYFTGHGGKGDKKNPYNTTIHLWENQKLKVSEFTQKLEALPTTQSTILIMVQCYSGGFANYIFKEGDPKKGLHPQPRAGFFATLHDRVAAGCTPDIREENYQEYSTRFWEALCGESRIGQKIQKPDYNKDGRTSLSEAHAYVIINSNTIDIPIKTSDVFLRKFSSFQPPQDKNSTVYKLALEALREKINNSPNEDDSNFSSTIDFSKHWIFCQDPLSKILISASSESNATIRNLSKKLDLNDEERFQQANKKIEELKKKRDELSKLKKEKDDKCKALKSKIKGRLKKEWPELENIYHPMVDILKKPDTSIKFLAIANQEKEWDKFKKLKEEALIIEAQRFKLEKNQVLAMRLKHEIENVVLKIAIPKINTPDIIERFSGIIELENTILE